MGGINLLEGGSTKLEVWLGDVPPMRLQAVTAFHESLDEDYVLVCIVAFLPAALPNLFLFQRTVTQLPNFYF